MLIGGVQDIGAVLREARLGKGLTQHQLAQMLGVTRQWVASVESGSSTARLGLVIDALKCVDILLDTHQDDSQGLVDRILRSYHE